MFKPEELLPREAWTFVLSRLSTKDELSCRCVSNSFKREVDSILKNNQNRLWLRHRDDDYAHYFCYDKDHRITSRDILYFDKTISIKQLKFVSALMPSLRILQLDPLDQVYREDYNEDRDFYYNVGLPDYRDYEEEAVPITMIFPQVACLILPGRTEKKNFTGHLSQVTHLTFFNNVEGGSPTFPNLDSLEVRNCWNFARSDLLMPSKRFVVPKVTFEWSTLPKTLEVIETRLMFDEYISVGKPHFSNLKILKGTYGRSYSENPETVMNFLKDHKESLTELSFSTEKEVVNMKVLLPMLTNLQKLSVKIETVKQAMELKEIKALAYNLQYFELCCDLCWGTQENLRLILDNLPLGLDNLSIGQVEEYEEIIGFMEKIIEKIVNGATKTVTFAGLDNDESYSTYIIWRMTPSPLRVEKRNTRVHEEDHRDSGSRTEYSKAICDIVISL